MDTYWFNKLINLLKIQTNSENEKLMVLYLDKELRKLKLDYQIDAVGNILVIKGKTNMYPCVVSHMDTVHDFVPNFKVYKDIDNDDVLFAMNGKQRVGIGGDDKCGVFACLYLLKTIPQIKVVFFSREENGCKGSMGVNKTFFANCRYLIQLDRRGNKDFIQTYWGNKTVSHEFSSEVGFTKKKYKYKNKTGTVTDVMKLWYNKVGVSCINLSCGYYNPHTDYEYISIKDLWHSVKFTEEIINTMKPKRYTSLPPKPTITKVSYVTNYQSKHNSQCSKCKKWKKDALLYTIKGNDKDGKHGDKICWPCKKEQYTKEEWDVKLSYATTNPPATSQNNVVVLACNECGIKKDEMEKGDSLRYVNGELYCNKCAAIFFVFDKEPAKCFVCNRVIPKDHKIIERFGVRVCDDCALPSDTEVKEN